MGILWTVWPLDEQMKSWLVETGIDYPDTKSRFPTGIEIKSALSQLKNYDVNITDNGIGHTWQAMINKKEEAMESEWTVLNISEYSGDEHPQKLWFEKGWESLIHQILHNIVPYCGPLVLIADSGDDPVIISNLAI
ncbi:hypothetical protein ACO0LF_30620 [Undibacterium sp. Di27W]|uniref:hypothetical protein n=1 Tax=Undibacterium sp. Di27W TaxID=3413036 RepID=UPI003BF0B817